MKDEELKARIVGALEAVGNKNLLRNRKEYEDIAERILNGGDGVEYCPMIVTVEERHHRATLYHSRSSAKKAQDDVDRYLQRAREGPSRPRNLTGSVKVLSRQEYLENLQSGNIQSLWFGDRGDRG